VSQTKLVNPFFLKNDDLEKLVQITAYPADKKDIDELPFKPSDSPSNSDT
jgi:hypothetical protein